MIKSASFILFFLFCLFMRPQAQDYFETASGKTKLTLKGASHLASLPLKCIDKEYPVKQMFVMSDSSYSTVKKMNPAFYGCFDWHSCVHGNWLLVSLLKQFPDLPEKKLILEKLTTHITAENIQTELKLFSGDNKSFERPYGWGWLLQLQRELLTWDDPVAIKLSANLRPLAAHISSAYIIYLNKLSYPIREPEHLNLAFSMCFAWDYGIQTGDTALTNSIRKHALRFYGNDRACPISYEPGGYDFLSPCLEEADIMQRILDKKEFNEWLGRFLPELYSNPESLLRIAEVSDPTDGKIVHLHGLNFSRAWCLYHIAAKMNAGNPDKVRELAMKHFTASFPHVASGAYEGEHWLASFAEYALIALGN